jgi:hypothetical protein
MGGLIFTLGIIAAANTQRQESQTAETPKGQVAQEIQVRGKVVCLAEEMHKLYDSDFSPNHEHLYGVKAKDGSFYTLLRTKLSEALFVDERLHKKELMIKGRTFPKTQILEAISLQSIDHGVVHDLYYYCYTCAIRSVAPGDCECCQEPVELVEKPLKLVPLSD